MVLNKNFPYYIILIVFSQLPDDILQVLPSPMKELLHEQLKDPTVFVHEARVLRQSSVPLAHSSISGNKQNNKKYFLSHAHFPSEEVAGYNEGGLK